MNNELVLVTGGSGFVGVYCILALLDAGFRVRTTVRSTKRIDDVQAMLHQGGDKPADVAFAIADLSSDAGWHEAVAGCRYVLHVASPFPPAVPKHENDLIIPARDGALRVLRAARDGGVKRVVMTSSFAAIGYGHKPTTQPFTEVDWSNVDYPGMSAYAKSKTLAEHAAWDFVNQDGAGLELSVINPTAILGPLLSPDYSTSIQLIIRMMNGAMPGLPRLAFGIVDVRDVADLHLRAMTSPAAQDQRFLAISGDVMTLQEIAETLKARLGPAAKRVPTIVLPNWLVRIAGNFDPAIKAFTPELGKIKNASSRKAQRILGWSPRSREDAIVATAESLIRLGLVGKR